MNDDTKEALAKHGVYRARIEKHEYLRWRRQDQSVFDWQVLDEPPSSIQNLDILANTFASFEDYGNSISCSDLARILPSLLAHMSDHVHCQVRLELPEDRSIGTKDVEGLKVLRIFREATVKASSPLVHPNPTSSLTDCCHSYATPLKRRGRLFSLTLPRTRCIGSMRIRRLWVS